MNIVSRPQPDSPYPTATGPGKAPGSLNVAGWSDLQAGINGGRS